ncbi:DUF3578 domain-containing protein, partial [Neobacillus vireti]|uniref:MrcB family domain-containing protein n=1 Tax=Neobacillus vireti TaxID=220686 RepID=UPI00300067A8
MRKPEFHEHLSIIMEDRGLKGKDVSVATGILPNVLSQYKTGARQPEESVQREILAIVESMAATKKGMFKNRLKFINKYNDYQEYGKVQKEHPVNKFITEDIPNGFHSYLEEIGFPNLEFLKIKGKTGAGIVAEAKHVALLDNRITESTRFGCYPVWLWDGSGENLYATIAFGVESVKDPMVVLPIMTKGPKKILKEAIV